MNRTVCRGCGSVGNGDASQSGFCPHCFASFAGELLSLYDWMRTQSAKAHQQRDLAFVNLLLPTYRHTLHQSETLRAKAAFPESLLDNADEAQDALGILESVHLRGEAAVHSSVSFCRETMAEIEAELSNPPANELPDELTVHALFYYSHAFRCLYEKGLIPRERDFEADEQLARTLHSKIATADSPPLDETDGTFGPPPNEILSHIEAVAFGNP